MDGNSSTFYNSGGDGMLCNLLKALYGLRQSFCALFDRFSKVILTLGFRRSSAGRAGHTLFVWNKNGVTATILC